MARGKDKVILGSDLQNMSPQERAGLGNLAIMGKAKITGAAVVRGKDGNAKYTDPSRAGKYHEDKL